MPDIITKADKERILLGISRTPLLPEYTVVELETGHAISSFETEAEAVASFAFAGLRPEHVRILSNVPLMAAMSGSSTQAGSLQPRPHPTLAIIPSPCPAPPSE